MSDNFTRAVRFERPDFIPMRFVINPACWHHYPKDALWELMEEHKLLFPYFKRPDPSWMPHYAPVARKDEPYTDPMGCTWYTSDNGITGTVLGHPLADWSAFGRQWQMPDPDTTDGLYAVDWAEQESRWASIKYGCPYDYVLKDISTVNHRPENLIIWAQTVSDVLDIYYD